jgi:hypothetical protein
LRAVVAYAPSSVAWPGIISAGPSWTYRGKPIPFVPYSGLPRSQDGGKTIVLLNVYSLKNKDALEKAAIPVERINGPVMLVSGKDDHMWPSSVMGDMVIARLKEKNHPYKDEHHSYEGAGHGIGVPYRSTKGSMSGGGYSMGGTPQANAKADADSWPKVLRFLKEVLKK